MPNQYTVPDDAPWKDKETLREAYYDDRTTQEIADEWGCSAGTIYRWVDKFGFERRQKYDGPWTDREKLIELYWGEGLTQQEIAERFDCNQVTISEWFKRHDIPARNLESEYGTVSTTEDGYVYFNGKNEQAWIHQLVAIANGESPYEVFSPESNCHHKNSIPWDNRPENITVLSVSEHIKEHWDELYAARREIEDYIDRGECQDIRDRWQPNDNVTELADEYDVTESAIWKHAAGKCGHE